MFIINKANVCAIREKLNDSSKRQEVIADVKKMLEIKDYALWRSDKGICCGPIGGLTACIADEVTILEKTVAALEKGDLVQASLLLQEYENTIQEVENPKW
jgi:hypothetical protein